MSTCSNCRVFAWCYLCCCDCRGSGSLEPSQRRCVRGQRGGVSAGLACTPSIPHRGPGVCRGALRRRCAGGMWWQSSAVRVSRVVGLVLVFRFWCWFLMLWCWCWCLAFSDVFCASSIPAPPGRSQCEHALSHCGVHVWLCVPRSRARWSGRRVQRRTYRRCPSGRRAVLRGTCHNPHWVPWREVSVCWWWSHFWLASACLFAAPPPRHGWFEWCSLGGAG